jgi:hypothetical protein
MNNQNHKQQRLSGYVPSTLQSITFQISTFIHIPQQTIYMAPKNAIYLGQNKPNKVTLITLQVTDNSLYKPYMQGTCCAIQIFTPM